MDPVIVSIIIKYAWTKWRNQIGWFLSIYFVVVVVQTKTTTTKTVHTGRTGDCVQLADFFLRYLLKQVSGRVESKFRTLFFRCLSVCLCLCVFVCLFPLIASFFNDYFFFYQPFPFFHDLGQRERNTSSADVKIKQTCAFDSDNKMMGSFHFQFVWTGEKTKL